ncbi:MAG TPA: DNA-directed RNA polymerase [Candidatus Paceibacterota bacterium]|nr:DNA-directed RNA polymerase [Candidatus Paceibacterota bacterium]HPC37500.1 DNA-directed RNA polymerase [Candidatus Paceibacterota bacterium]HRU35964.1 DNA-directed RNA polymerase [Candidatus Paceibacterota bacterium]
MEQRNNFGGGERQMFHPNEGEKWICAECGAEITELPFDPRRDENGVVSGNLYCRDCHKKRQSQFRNRQGGYNRRY